MPKKEIKNSEEEYSQLIPMVVEKSPYGERAYDIYSRLLNFFSMTRSLTRKC